MPNRDMVDTSVRGSLLVLANEAPVDELGIVPVMAAVRAASAWDVRRVPLRDLETVLAQSPAKRILGGSPKAVSAPVFQRAIAIASACGARIVVATNGATTDAASTVRLANAPCVDLVPLVPRFEVPILAGALHATPECMLHMALLVHVCGASSALPRVVRERLLSSLVYPVAGGLADSVAAEAAISRRHVDRLLFDTALPPLLTIRNCARMAFVWLLHHDCQISANRIERLTGPDWMRSLRRWCRANMGRSLAQLLQRGVAGEVNAALETILSSRRPGGGASPQEWLGNCPDP